MRKSTLKCLEQYLSDSKLSIHIDHYYFFFVKPNTKTINIKKSFLSKHTYCILTFVMEKQMVIITLGLIVTM